MPSTPPTTLERALASHGDLLLRMALLVAEDERQAIRLLRVTVRRAARAQPAALDAPGLLALLLEASRQAAARRTARRRRHFRLLRLFSPATARPGADLYRAVHDLALPRRQALGLHLLLGYDIPLAARVSGVSEEQHRELLIDGLHGLGRATSIRLPGYQPTDACPPARRAIVDNADRFQRDSLLRGHLASCSACRAFDHAWTELTQRVEAALRDALRDRELPAATRASMIAGAQPLAQRLQASALRFAAAPLAVLLIIAALVLPGMFRQPPAAAEIQAPLADPRALVQQSLAQVGRPPEGNGIWYGRWRTLWYFDNGTYAPVRAEAWIDPRQQARHRLQLTHADGGAPYELQIGDGRQQLWYAIDAAYYPSVYGGEGPEAVGQPDLRRLAMPAGAQRQALAARLRTGAWDIAPSYLRQAHDAPDLRTLGRQRLGKRVVQLVTFSGYSPLGLPPDAPGAQGKVTVLLALDLADGRLRSATELVGPPGGEQTSRVTWRLEHEEWLATAAQIRPALDPSRAWTGRGQFSRRLADAGPEPALPLVVRHEIAPLARLLLEYGEMVWMPSTLPPGADRALLRWWADYPGDGGRRGPRSVTYLGEGRWLTLHFGTSGGAGRWDEQLRVGPWMVYLRAERGQRYHARLERVGPEGQAGRPDDPGTWMLIDAAGFSRGELLDVVRSLAPLDTGSLMDQGPVFISPEDLPDTAARAALMEALAFVAPPAAGEVLYLHRVETLDAALELARSPVFLPPSDGRMELAEIYAMAERGAYQSTNALRTALAGAGSLLFIFRDRRDTARQVLLLQGPLAPLRASFQALYEPPWRASELVQLTVAGRAVDGWLIRERPREDACCLLFVEIDGALLVIRGRGPRFIEEVEPFLASLRARA